MEIVGWLGGLTTDCLLVDVRCNGVGPCGRIESVLGVGDARRHDEKHGQGI